MRVLIVQTPAFGDAVGELTRTFEEAGADVTVINGLQAFTALEACDWEIVAGPGSLRCDDAFFARNHRVQAVVVFGSGADGVDLASATAHGVLVGHGGTLENARGMASATLMLMLALLHDLKGAEATLRQGKPAAAARSLYGLDVGLIGFGKIAREVAALLAPWEVRLSVCAPRLEAGQVPAGVRRVDLEGLLATCDVVSVHANLTEETRGLLDARRLALMKPGAILLNVARGQMVDEDALARLLHEGRIAGAALDVFAIEPLPADSALRSAPNTVLTPHTIGQTAQGRRSLVDAMADNVTRLIWGEPPGLLKNPDAVARWRARLI